MEWIRRLLFFLLGMIMAASAVIADDRMAQQYGLVSVMDVNQEARQMIAEFKAQKTGSL